MVESKVPNAIALINLINEFSNNKDRMVRATQS